MVMVDAVLADASLVSQLNVGNVGSRATPEHQHHHLIILEVVKLHHNVVYKQYSSVLLNRPLQTICTI
jgi:hypothetical protein